MYQESLEVNGNEYSLLGWLGWRLRVSQDVNMKRFIVHKDKESETISRAHTKGCYGYDIETEKVLLYLIERRESSR